MHNNNLFLNMTNLNVAHSIPSEEIYYKLLDLKGSLKEHLKKALISILFTFFLI